jgi:hypothetical protein
MPDVFKGSDPTAFCSSGCKTRLPRISKQVFQIQGDNLMKLDLGPFGTILGWAIGIILIGAVASTGLGVLVGKGAREVPMFFADVYYGLTNKEFVLDQDTEFLGIKVVNDEWKFLGIFPMDGPYSAGKSDGARALTGESVSSTTPSGVQWEEPSSSPPSSSAEGATNEGGATVNADCVRAKATLTGLKGGDAYKVRDAANAVLNSCTEAADIETASAALTAAQTQITQLEAAAAAREQTLKNWETIVAAASQLQDNDAVGATQSVRVAGGEFFFSGCDGLYPGIFENLVGGGEDCNITIYPPEIIEDDASSVTFTVDLSTLWSWGFGEDTTIGGTVPEEGKVYQLESVTP